MSVLLATVSGFASGIFLESLFILTWPVVAFTLILAIMSLGAALYSSRLAYALLGLALIFAIAGGTRSAWQDVPPDAFLADVGKRVSYEGVVVGDPDLRDANQRTPVRVTENGSSVTVLAVVPRTTVPAVGDRVRVSGTLEVPEPFASDGGRVFRYDKYLEARGIRFLLSYGSISVEEPAPWYAPSAALARVKHAFLDGLAHALPEPYAALAGGIVIGGKSGLGTELQGDFTRSGLVHTLVLSGHNVMVVAEWTIIAAASVAVAMSRVSPRVRMPRALPAALAGATLLIFVGIAGFSATALRAASMALIALYAKATGRTYAASHALLVAILLMLFWNPLYLVFDPSFGLSVAATAGLIWLAPLVETRLTLVRSSFFRDALATTLAAQIAVLPLLLYETGNLSLVSILANVLVMPIVPLTMACAALAGLGGILFPSALSILIGLPAYLTAAYLIFIARSAAALPGAALILPAFPFWATLAAYAALIALAASKRASITPQLRFAKNAST